MYNFHPLHVDRFPRLAESITQLLGLDTKVAASLKPSDASCKEIQPLQIFMTAPNSYGEERTDYLGSFWMDGVHGCCGVCVSFHASVDYRRLHKGLGRLFLRWRLYLAWEMGFTQINCTTKEHNVISVALLKSEGFKEVYRFDNRRTRNTVLGFSRTLTAADGDWDARAKEVIERKRVSGSPKV